MKQAKISTQYPDKYGFKAPDGPPVGMYDVAEAQDRIRSKSPFTAIIKEPMTLDTM